MVQALMKLDALLPIGNLDAYIQAVNKIPMLSQEQEQALALRLKREGDLTAARDLILPHLRFVVRIARNYSGYGLMLSDLIQEGTIGLMKAVKRFDPKQGVRLVTFAIHWIKAEIHEFILRNWRIVKIATTKAQRKLFFNKQRLGQGEVADVAQELGVELREANEMRLRLNAPDASLDATLHDEENTALIHHLTDQRYDPARMLADLDYQARGQDALQQALSALDLRSREILTARWLMDKKATLQELAERYGVSAERIRQLEQSALNRLKAIMQGKGIEELI